MKSILTRAIVRRVHRAPCDGTERVSLLAEPTLVYTYRSPDPPFAQVTPLGTVLWNATYMDQLSPLARRVVLRHECSHRDRNGLFKLAFAGAMGLFGVGPLFVIRAALLVVRDGAYAEGALSGLVGLALILTAVLAVRFEEGLADYHALREVGAAQFLGAYEEIEALAPGTTTHRLVTRVVYPRPRTVVRIRRHLQRSARDDPSPVRSLLSLLTRSDRDARR